MTQARGKPVVVCGYGRLGRGIFALLAKLGLSVHVISREHPADWPEPVPAGGRLLTLAEGPAGAPPGAGRRTDRFSGIRLPLQGLREWWRETPGALRVTLAALLIVAAGSIGVFHFGLGLPWVDALYFVFTIITTTGFGDFNLMNAPAALKLYGVFLMLCGAAILAAVFSIITDMALSTRLKDVFARGCSQYTGHIIVAGLGNVGLRVLKALREKGEQAVAVEQDENGKFVRTARTLAPVVLGNARMEETLRKAGAAGAKAIIAVTDNDISNLSIGLAAKRLRPDCRTVLRIFDADLAERMDGKPAADCALSVARIAAATFAASALDAGVISGFELEGGLAAFAESPDGGAGDPDDRGRSAGRAAIVLPAAGRSILMRWHKFKSAAFGPSPRDLPELPPEKAPPC
jgi:Trk K+ transport system NAD-binding subunit